MENILKIPLDEDTGLILSMAFLRNVTNSREIKEKVMSGELQCCVIKANVIADPFQVVVAANKAALSNLQGKCVTKSVYTEILFNLSVSKNISQSLVKFGIGDTDQDVLVGVLHKEADSCSFDNVLKHIDGKIVPIDELHQVSDKKLIVKTYKIGQAECARGSLVDSIVSRMATCDFVSH